MLHRTLFNIARRKICTNAQMLRALENRPKFNSKQCSSFVHYSYPQQNFTSIISKRFKSKGSVTKDVKKEEEEDELDVDDYLKTEKSKLISTYVDNLRLDSIAKIGFQMSRAKIDKEFYNNNIRLNGKKCSKKNTPVFLNDEIDLILSRSPTNPNNLIVNRCKLMVARIREDCDVTVHIVLLQNKNLLIEDYDKGQTNE